MSRPPFLRIPPFPRHRAAPLCIAAAGPSRDDAACDALAAALVAARVGGAFWHPARDPWGDGGAVDAGEAALVAALRGGGAGARAAVRAICGGLEARDPFFGGALDWAGAVALLAGWRALIEANRGFAGIFGIARWKRATMDAMLWDGAGPVRYLRAGDAGRLGPGDVALVWVARAPAGLMGRLAARGVQAGEIEDGFVRSAGLGANCVPPLSVVCDSLGTHIDPARASVIETVLAGSVPADAVARAAGLRAALVAGGVGKYGAGGGGGGGAPRGARRRVLVCGQVEDDRSVLLGGAGVTNAALLARARAMEPEAEVIWRPHPDVEAGHRKGAIPAEVVALADRVERDAAIADLFAAVDAVHVISSLAGFEALLRGRAVVCHGVPFYAGWGLTQDLAPVPARRGRRVTLDELVAAALIVAPRYLDPVTRLPCGPEVVVARLAAGAAGMMSPLVRVRMAWGRVRKLLQR